MEYEEKWHIRPSRETMERYNSLPEELQRRVREAVHSIEVKSSSKYGVSIRFRTAGDLQTFEREIKETLKN